MENSSNTYVKNSAGTFLENITKNTKNILGGVSNTQESNNLQQQNTPVDWSKFIINDFPVFTNLKPSKKVLCNDGTIQFQSTEPNAKVMMACAKNGGSSANQPIDFTKYEEEKFKLALEQKKIDAEKAMSDAQKNNTKEPIYYILVTAGVMIAGYFAYKKFKK
jgi:hypothetical protein